MATSFEKSFSFSLLCCECASFRFRFEGGIWDLIVLILDHFISFYFKCPVTDKKRSSVSSCQFLNMLLNHLLQLCMARTVWADPVNYARPFQTVSVLPRW